MFLGAISGLSSSPMNPSLCKLDSLLQYKACDLMDIRRKFIIIDHNASTINLSNLVRTNLILSI